MREIGGDQPLELGDEPVHLFRRKVELEDLDGDEPLALRVERAKDRPQRPRPNLMKNSKRSERVWRRRAGGFRVQ